MEIAGRKEDKGSEDDPLQQALAWKPIAEHLRHVNKLIRLYNDKFDIKCRWG
jgi:hypothetical protein